MVSMIEPVLHGPRLLDAMRRGQGGEVRVWPLGQAGLCIRFPEATVYVDLYLSSHCEATLPRPFDHRRLTRAPLDAAEVDDADVVVCTHDHLDHLDIPTMRTLSLANPEAVVVAPHAAGEVLEALGWEGRTVRTTASSGEVVSVGAVDLTPFPVAHEEYELTDNGHRFQGYLIASAGVAIAHVGDALATDELIQWLTETDVDLLCLPINGRDEERASMGFAGNMSAEEAVELGLTLGVNVLALHHDMFAQNIDAHAVRRFRDACTSSGVSGHVVPVGASMVVAP
jgi:L-ascorbate metabolism protein UlaG (beta-lactamase superfamily)